MTKHTLTPLVDRLWARVDKNGPTPVHRPDLGPCWLWQGCIRQRDGYGKIRVGRNPQGDAYVHRVAYAAAFGSIPDRLELDHLCRVRHCCNPTHLEPVSHTLNMKRGFHATKTACPAGHPYDAENTYTPPKGGRICRACRRIGLARIYRAKHG